MQICEAGKGTIQEIQDEVVQVVMGNQPKPSPLPFNPVLFLPCHLTPKCSANHHGQLELTLPFDSSEQKEVVLDFRKSPLVHFVRLYGSLLFFLQGLKTLLKRSLVPSLFYRSFHIDLSLVFKTMEFASAWDTWRTPSLVRAGALTDMLSAPGPASMCRGHLQASWLLYFWTLHIRTVHRVCV